MTDTTAVKIVAYGTTLVSHIHGYPGDSEHTHVVRATFENMRHADGHHDTHDVNGQVIAAKWRLDLYVDEALELAEALIRHARAAVAT